MKNTLTMDECVMLNLSTYNELYDKARMLDSIVEDTIATVHLEKREATDYNKLRVEPNGALVLPAYVTDQILDHFVARLANQSDDFIRSMVEANVHRIDFSNFSFESYRCYDNPLEFDLMKNPEFKRRWEQERAALEQEQEQECANIQHMNAAEASTEEEDE